MTAQLAQAGISYKRQVRVPSPRHNMYMVMIRLVRQRRTARAGEGAVCVLGDAASCAIRRGRAAGEKRGVQKGVIRRSRMAAGTQGWSW